jgi:GTP-binding protein Era
MRFGTVSLIGRTNVGKSTFLNHVLGQALAITSPLPQTTRDALLGVMQHVDSQVGFIDTPGLHKPRTELGKRMNHAALDTLRAADVALFITDTWEKPPKVNPVAQRAGAAPGPSPWIRPGDQEIIDALRSANVPAVLAINKVDLARDKSRLLPMLEAYSQAFDFASIVPMSLRRDIGVKTVLSEITQRLAEGPSGYDSDVLTNRPVLFFVREYVREAVMNQLRSEVPHAVAVTIEQANETEALLRISATIHVEKLGQRKIVVGKAGSQIKAIGIAARQRIEALVEKQVHLELFVRITDEWKDAPRKLAELGYDPVTTLRDAEVKGE